MFFQYYCRPGTPFTVKGRVQIDVEPNLASKPEIRACLVVSHRLEVLLWRARTAEQ